MAVAACAEHGEIRLESRPRPQPGPGEMLLALRCAGLCGTDLFKIRYGTVPPGTVLGHEVVGTVEANPSGRGRPFFNSAAFCYRGKVAAIGRKCLLPTYDVFDEDRYFEPATAPTVIDHAGHRIGLTICEDIWTHPTLSTRRLYGGRVPLEQLAEQRCDLMINLSASPWHSAKESVRQNIVVGDADGVAIVPQEMAEAVLERLAAVRAAEAKAVAAVEAGAIGTESVRQLVASAVIVGG